MNAIQLNIEQNHVHKLLCAANGDAALLYLYIQSGNDPANAAAALQLNETRVSCAGATLRQLGLWPENKNRIIAVGERPNYSEVDVVEAMNCDNDFTVLYDEIQRLFGRRLNTEELKILLGFVRYLGLPAEVICVLVCYCKERAMRRGSGRMPSLRTIEKEAYAWAEMNIETMEDAAAYIRQQNIRNSQLSKLMEILQIRGRNLTPGEEKYAKQWMDWGFEEEAIAMAYERTCLNTGGLSWAYMNKILTRWHNEGLHTAQQIRTGDKGKATKNGPRQLDEDEKAALAAMMQEV